MYTLTISALLATAAIAGLPSRFCQEPEVKQNFDIEAYTGYWYEQHRDAATGYESGTCDTTRYTLQADGTVRVQNQDYLNGEWDGVDGFAYQKEPEKEDGYLMVQFPDFPTGDYRVIATDYDNYAVVYACTYIPFKMVAFEQVWVLGRDPVYSQEAEEAVKAAMAAKVPLYGFEENLERTVQGDFCPYATAPNYYPENSVASLLQSQI